ncbi:MAG: 5-formyltetrahydrofolate cyclo-ligase [Pelagibacterales bacterium]|jgi:5-formyltetrahydrofolate cyclo-ligase|nr:5-formyltetrahydrofolate cyclo-ligase [Pelagibacterales bacterium]
MENNKLFLRKLFKKYRSELTDIEAKELNKSIFKNLINTHLFKKTHYHIYLSNLLNNEVETDEVIKLLFRKNKRVYAPKIIGNNLIHIEINKHTKYSENQFSIREPVSTNKSDPKIFDVVFIPLLAFDKFGERVGYGGGYYDRFLVNTQKNVLKVGLSYFEPVDKILDIEEHDIKLDFVITPSRVHNFT